MQATTRYSPSLRLTPSYLTLLEQAEGAAFSRAVVARPLQRTCAVGLLLVICCGWSSMGDIAVHRVRLPANFAQWVQT